MDRVTKEQRSHIMSKIRGKNTKPESIMFEALETLGIEFEKHYKLLGNPDMVFPKQKIAVFIDGDFWHGWNYEKRKEKLPKYWVEKIKRNMRRDVRYRRQLKNEGWTVLRLWEHKILKRPESCITRIKKVIASMA